MREEKQAGRRSALVGLGAGIVAAGLSPQAFAASHRDDTASLEAATEALRSALVNGDGDVLKKILNEKMTYSHSDGRVWTKPVLLENIAGKKRYLSIATSEQTVYISGPTGIVRHTYDVVNNDAKTSTSHIKVLLCWTMTKSGWQLMARGSTTVPA
ncbi:nuclear transport factor 2 family protein [Robbsia sp. KACC 23696]|uniref:nuclear transport factor 2 family protein n=1 Tax=Robbsia sp. KACC 23696 TaxID=3149231 RepID=UPI00325BCD02